MMDLLGSESERHLSRAEQERSSAEDTVGGQGELSGEPLKRTDSATLGIQYQNDG